jgi:HlyD family secretion protein
MSRIRIATGVVLAAGVAAAAVWALWPEPLAVDLARVTRGPMEGVLMAEGVTRVRDPHTIAAPISGTTMRSPVAVGDPVVKGETLVAVIRPGDPALMDVRTRAQAEAAVAEAEASVHVADANIARAVAAQEYAAAQAARGRSLAATGTLSQRLLDDLEQAERDAAQAVTAAEAARDLALATLRRARATLTGPDDIAAEAEPGDCCVQIRAPLTGIVLDVVDRNARAVTAGSALVTLGDLATLDLEIDLLSQDAVGVSPGAPARVDRWGGAGVLEARVRRIEPAAFTRVSALGIEEQRVRVQLDLLAPPEDRAGLGDGFRVQVGIVLWQAEAALQVPQSALFRQGDGWAVFREVDGVAVLTPVVPGRQAGTQAEVLGGLEAGAAVVIYPPGTLSDGARIVARAD